MPNDHDTTPDQLTPAEQIEALQRQVDRLTAENARLKEVTFEAPIGERTVIKLPSTRAALDVGLNAFAFQLVGETMANAAPRNPSRLPVIVTVHRDGFVIDVEARFVPETEVQS